MDAVSAVTVLAELDVLSHEISDLHFLSENLVLKL
jgi:hypothetical protein